MFRIKYVVLIACICFVFIASAACADRLIVIPTGDNLVGIRGEFLQMSGDNGKILAVNAGISRLEVEGVRFEGFAGGDGDSLSAQMSILPETSFTPSLAAGARDIGDDTKHLGMPYDGRSFYLVASKSIPVTGGIPGLFQDVKAHGGVGTGSLSGIFLGVEGKLPMGIRLAGEFDTNQVNAEVSYNLVPQLRVEAASIHGDVFYGADFRAAF